MEPRYLAYLSPASVDRLPVLFVLCAGLLAFGLIFFIWPVIGHALTTVHEGGHAFVASLFGFRITSITMRRDRSGLTTWLAPEKAIGSMFAGLAGYVGPALFGVVGAALLGAGRAVAMFWISFAFLVVEFASVRNLFGFVSMLVLGGLIFAVLRYAPLTVAVFFGYVWVWILLIGGVRDAWGLHKVRQKARADKKPAGTDSDILKKNYGLPGPIWTGLMGLLAMCGLLVGAGLLLRILPWH